MEQLSSLEQPYIDKARHFLAENSPEYNDLESYRHERLAQVHEGEKLWIAKEVGNRVRVFELQDGTRHSTDALLFWDVEAVGLDAYICLIYREGAQEAFNDSMPSAKRWLETSALDDKEAEEALLGMVLTKIEELTA